MVFEKQAKYTSYNYRIYDLIPLKKKVLDVGCATGKLLEELKSKKDCYTVGIEADKEESQEAKIRCDQLIEGDIEKLQDLPFPAGFFDVIIFADVLEHLKRPDEVLKKTKPYLKDNGYLLASIPNVAFLSVRLNLLFGNFDYTEYGLLDKSHLRFFTLKTVKKLIEEQGYSITHLEGYNQVKARYSFIKPLGRFLQSLFASDFIIKAVKRLD